MKKFLLTTFIFLALVLTLTILVNAETYGDLTYKVSNGEVIITGGSYDAGEITIPSTIDGYPVVAIGEDAFAWCEKLVTITIPASVRSIGWYAFEACHGLRNVIFEEGSQCTLICGKAFYLCTGLRYLVIPESVTDIGWQAFDVCKNLRIYGKLGSIAESYAKSASIPFEEYVDTSILTYTIADGKVTITGCDTSAVSVIIPMTIKGYPVTAIGKNAFSSCEKLTSLTFVNNSKVASIGAYAFSDCTGLKSITIPKSVTSVSEYAFSSCTSLENVTFEEYSKCTFLGNYAFYNCTNLAYITLPDTLSTIGTGAFENCTKLMRNGLIDGTDIVWKIDGDGVLTISGVGDIPDYSTSVRSPWYANKEDIKCVIVEDGITGIGAQAFAFLENATSIKLAESVKFVGQLFMRNTAVEEIDLSFVETVGEGAFNAATNLKTIIFSEKLRDCQGNIFANTQTITIKTPKNSYAYSYANFFSTMYSGKATVTALSDGTTAESPVIVFGKMGDNAFYAIYEETDRNVMEVSGKGTTYNYWFISERRIEMDKEMGGNNFAPIYYLYEDASTQPIVRAIKKLTIHKGITSIGNYSFYRCLKAREVEILGDITWIGNAAFQACEAIREIHLPESCTRFGNNVFNGCKYLYLLTIPGNVKEAGDRLFLNCLLENEGNTRPEVQKLTIKTNSTFFKNYINTNYPLTSHRLTIKAN